MDGLAEFFRLRADIYNLLSVVFYRELDAKHAENLRKYVPVLREYALQYGQNEMLDAIGELESCLAAEPDYGKEAAEFARLFLGVEKAGTGHTITPHESVFLSSDRLVMQKPWEEVREEYYNAGIAKDKDFKEPEDHMTAEMSYIAHMSRKMAESLSGGGSGVPEAELQKMFLRNHIECWMPLLAADIYANSSSDYIKAAVKTAWQYVMIDRALLEEWSEEKSL